MIYEDGHIEVYHHQGKSNFLVITFNEMGTLPGRGSWGSRALQKNEISYLGFVSKKPNWFPGSSMERAKHALISTLDAHSEVVMYGHSQGGYAAVRYASLYRAKSIIAFCPQFSIRPESMSGKDKRFARHYPSTMDHQEIGPYDVGADCRTHIFYDPNDELDRLNFLHIKEKIPHARSIKVFGTGHQSVRAIANSDAVGKILSSAASNDTLGILKALRESKRKWPARSVFLARDIARRNADAAIRLIDGYAGEITSDVAPGLVRNLFLSCAYKFLSENIERFLPNASPGVKIILLKSLISSDKLDLAQKYGNAWIAEQKDNESLRALVTSIDQTTFLKGATRSPFEACFTFGEGWNQAELWGRWSSSERARIFIKSGNSTGVIRSVRIPISTLSRPKQRITARYLDNGSWVNAIISKGYLTINNCGTSTIIDIFVNNLYSPLHLKFNNDNRLMGVKIPSIDKWIITHRPGSILTARIARVGKAAISYFSRPKTNRST
ncbi:hypothetical protein EMIT0194P_160154 [Pseudomonas serbica]